MSLYDDVEREALHDWLDQRRGLAADERPDSSEFEDRYDERADDWREELEPDVDPYEDAA